MRHINTTAKSIGLFILSTLLMALVTGCSEEAPKPETQEAPPIPTAESVDLSQTTDLFEEPIQPSPLVRTDEDVVITVNDEEITHGAIMQATQMQMMRLSQQVPQQQLAQLYPRVYQEMSDMLVANILLGQAAEKSSLAVSDTDLATEIAQVEANAPEGKTLQDLLSENNIDFEEWKKDLLKRMLIGKLVEEKTVAIENATETEVAEFYQENAADFKIPEAVSASHILLGFNPEDTDETKAKKKENLTVIREQILAGGNFEELAAEHSSCPSSQKGGALGSFSRGQMVPEFEEAAFGMKTGDISELIETQFGYHLIKVTSRQEEGVRALAEVKDQLLTYLSAQKKQEALVMYVEELKEKATIEYKRLDLDAATEK